MSQPRVIMQRNGSMKIGIAKWNGFVSSQYDIRCKIELLDVQCTLYTALLNNLYGWQNSRMFTFPNPSFISVYLWYQIILCVHVQHVIEFSRQNSSRRVWLKIVQSAAINRDSLLYCVIEWICDSCAGKWKRESFCRRVWVEALSCLRISLSLCFAVRMPWSARATYTSLIH